MVQHMEFGRLWNRRAGVFWKEAAIYWSYAARSGLSMFLLLLFIIGSYLYMKALQSLPATFAYWRISTPLLAFFLGWSPVRTFLREADKVFLLPAESKLRSYWSRSMNYSFGLQTITILAALVLLWPLYLHTAGADAISFAVAAILLLLAKRFALEAVFRENRLVYQTHRIAMRLMRWTGAVVLAFTALTQPWWVSLSVLILLVVAIAGALRYLPKHRIHWDLLVQIEKEQLLAHYTFFSWFADVPKLPAKPKLRMALARLTGLLAFDKNRTYIYLYAKTFLRSEWFGMMCRIVVFGSVCLAAARGHVPTGLCIYGIALLMLTATVSGLDQAHRYSFWLEIYPVSKSLRTGAIIRMAWTALLASNTLLGAVLLILQQGSWTGPAAAAAGYAFVTLYSWVFLRRRVRKSGEALF